MNKIKEIICSVFNLVTEEQHHELNEKRTAEIKELTNEVYSLQRANDEIYGDYLVLEEKTNQNKVPSSVQDLYSNDRIVSGGRSQADILRVMSQIGQYVAERQRLMKSLKPAIANLREGLAVNAKNSEAAKSVLLPNLNRSPDKIFPELLESMLEDENNDDIGVNSGKRNILSDEKIIIITVTKYFTPTPITNK
jgi:hypothetical protein